ncbi:MAG: hypothetical protein A2928_02620 [Candidatus Taylorbacteria bacterium RIFCSPLOWO2_01_FULL_45_15b]|uniref:Uncharacterized protein n=1 Tax=Candidatus Taylorbacteria bacterium RIFCSPLOWO2_01_FULL_45_15b TaxID=1802319 RepID=A0A1G2NDB8_9BACT|nr:MAG: hypothetical protein A2928_02620 [Candidatus Taylorbacteria bacterium RIFCSPLOWO2_01_FULL_45_15b]
MGFREDSIKKRVNKILLLALLPILALIFLIHQELYESNFASVDWCYTEVYCGGPQIVILIFSAISTLALLAYLFVRKKDARNVASTAQGNFAVAGAGLGVFLAALSTFFIPILQVLREAASGGVDSARLLFPIYIVIGGFIGLVLGYLKKKK